MKKNPLIGVSICAVVLLVLGSLTNVVGYQSVKSTEVNDSPLFRTRTQKATNQQQNIITSQYLGMGKGNLLQFPIRDNRNELLRRILEYISKMDDKAFAQFTELCIQQARQVNTLSDTNSNEITQMLHLLRTQPETITYSLSNRNNQNITSSNYNSICHWSPGCISYNMIIFIIALFAMVIFPLITLIFFGWTLNCWPSITYIVKPGAVFC